MKQQIIDTAIERFLIELTSLLSSPSTLREFFNASIDNDTKLQRLISLARKGFLLKYCTSLQSEIMFLRVGGRMFVSRKERHFIGGHEDGRTRSLTRGEMASVLGLSIRQLDYETRKAYRNINRAIDEQIDESMRYAANL